MANKKKEFKNVGLPAYFQVLDTVTFTFGFGEKLRGSIQKIHFSLNEVTYDVHAWYYPNDINKANDVKNGLVEDNIRFYNMQGRHMLKA